MSAILFGVAEALNMRWRVRIVYFMRDNRSGR